MTTDDARLDELRRLAFGRTTTAQDEARAAAARHELELLLAPPVVEVAPPPVIAREEPTPEPVAPPEAPPRRSWILPALVALVVGVLVGAGAMVATGRVIAAAPAPAPSPTATFTPGSSALPPTVVPLSADQPVAGSAGDFSAAMLWFDGDQGEEDKLDPMMLSDGSNDIVESSTRLVYSSKGSKVWVAQTSTSQLCMASTSGSNGALMCMTPDDFARTGIPLHVNGSLSVVWNGNRIVTSTNADAARDVRP